MKSLRALTRIVLTYRADGAGVAAAHQCVSNFRPITTFALLGCGA